MRDLLRLEEGATAVEYALILAAITAVIVIAVVALGGKVSALFASANESFPN